MTNGLKLKKKSKRMSCKRRYKIEKKVREHNRKLKKADNKKRKSGAGSKGKKDKPLEEQVPNSCPFKTEILEEAVARRKATEEERQQRRETLKDARAKARDKLLAQKRKAASSAARETKPQPPKPATLEEMVAGAAVRGEEFALSQAGRDADAEAAEGDLKSADSKTSSIKSFAGEVRRVLEASDVVFEVLDARDPLGSRCPPIEEQILKAGKRLVLLLNKIDLVPRANVQAWLVYLRKSFPTVAFKASTQEQKTKLGRAGSDLSTVSSKALGADLVIRLLGNYTRNRDIKTSIRVGFIGYPNVGKSSVINSLKRSRSCGVGAAPGVTRALQEVQLDSKIRLLDSPGVILAAKGSMDPVEIALKNAIRLENLEDPVAPVQAILRRCSKEALILQYNIPDFGSAQDFLVLLSRRLGKIKAGAKPDTNAAARKVLQDWSAGRLKYFTQPPLEALAPSAAGLSAESAAVVAEMGKEFSLDDLAEDQSLLVGGLSATANADAVLYDASVPLPMEDAGQTHAAAPSKKPATAMELEEEAGLSKAEAQLEGNRRRDTELKNRLKQAKKKGKRNVKLGEKLGASLDAAMDLGQPYDFKQHFPAE